MCGAFTCGRQELKRRRQNLGQREKSTLLAPENTSIEDASQPINAIATNSHGKQDFAHSALNTQVLKRRAIEELLFVRLNLPHHLINLIMIRLMRWCGRFNRTNSNSSIALLFKTCVFSAECAKSCFPCEFVAMALMGCDASSIDVFSGANNVDFSRCPRFCRRLFNSCRPQVKAPHMVGANGLLSSL